MMVAAATQHSLQLTLHQGFFTVLLLYSAALFIWGILLFLIGRNPSGSYLGALAILEGVAILQGILGLVLLVTGHRPHDALHYLYGVIAVVTLPTAYFLSDNGTTKRDSFVFSLAAVFLVGVALRGAMTGSGS